MSMPVIESSTTTRCQAITDIIESVALEQTALSHILNAEGEKIQKIVAAAATTGEMVVANKSVNDVIKSVSMLEIILQAKLGLFEDCLCTDCEPIPPCEEVTDVAIALEQPNPLITVVKNNLTSFSIVKIDGLPIPNDFIVTTTPAVPVVLKTAPTGVQLMNNELRINWALTTSGTIVLTVGTGECAIDVTITYSRVNP